MSRIAGLVLVVCMLACAGSARAVPTVRGATGLVFIPDTQVQDAAALFTEQGKVTTLGDKSFSAFEGGLMSQDGRTFYDGKIQLLPDITSDEEWVPGVAIGIRGVAAENDRREFYLVTSKKFSYPQCTIVGGLERVGAFKGSPTHGFYGLELPLFAGLEVLVDHENAGGTTNAGLRYTVAKTVSIYDYILDARGHTDTSKQNIVGACYQKHF